MLWQKKNRFLLKSDSGKLALDLKGGFYSVQSLLIFFVILVIIFGFFGMKAIPEGQKRILFRGGKFVAVKGSGAVFMIPFYDQLKELNLKPLDLKLSEDMVIASDREKLYSSGSIIVKILDPEKAYTVTTDFQSSIIKFVSEIIEELIKKTTYSDIMSSKRDFDNKITDRLKEKIRNWGIEIVKIKLNLSR